MLHGNLCPLYFPAVWFWANTKNSRLLFLGGWIEKCCDQAISMYRMVMHQLSQSVEPVLLCYKHLF